MNSSFMRRAYKDNNYEIWTYIFNYNTFTCFDTVLINFEETEVGIMVFSNSQKRVNSPSYFDSIYNIFEDVTYDRKYEIIVNFIINPIDYYPQEFIKLYKIAKEGLEINGKNIIDNFKGFKRLYRTTEFECWSSVFNDENGCSNEDRFVAIFDHDTVNIVIFSKYENHFHDIEYLDKIISNFSYTQNYTLCFRDDIDPFDYRVEDLIDLAQGKTLSEED